LSVCPGCNCSPPRPKFPVPDTTRGCRRPASLKRPRIGAEGSKHGSRPPDRCTPLVPAQAGRRASGRPVGSDRGELWAARGLDAGIFSADAVIRTTQVTSRPSPRSSPPARPAVAPTPSIAASHQTGAASRPASSRLLAHSARAPVGPGAATPDPAPISPGSGRRLIAIADPCPAAMRTRPRTRGCCSDYGRRLSTPTERALECRGAVSSWRQAAIALAWPPALRQAAGGATWMLTWETGSLWSPGRSAGAARRVKLWR
jgi:hypothetical protein